MINSGERPKQGELPALRMEERSCRTCKYFEFEGDERGMVSSGECRRHAPRSQSGTSDASSWPTVHWNQWCGEWEEGVSYEEMVRMARSAAES